MIKKIRNKKTRNNKIRNKKTRNNKTRNNITKNKKYKQKGGTFPVIEALTYNLSWASQKKEVAGSEADFVERCITINRDCYNEALKKITELHKTFKFDIIGIQEVEDANLVSAICQNTGLTGWYRGATWNSFKNIYSGCAIIWNTKTLGTMATGKTINLARVEENNKCDARTCCIVTTSKDVNLIVAHFPWIEKQKDLDAITEIIDAHISSTGPIIILADTNDSKTLISNDNPLVIKNKPLSHGLSKKDAKKFLVSCCWHKKKEKDDDAGYEHLTDTGDYILSEKVTNIGIPIFHPTNEPNETELYSDHMPVAATILL
jgi:endonuclease/exonuclease/phosphatase family metal-dependent hydrolase